MLLLSITILQLAGVDQPEVLSLSGESAIQTSDGVTAERAVLTKQGLIDLRAVVIICPSISSVFGY